MTASFFVRGNPGMLRLATPQAVRCDGFRTVLEVLHSLLERRLHPLLTWGGDLMDMLSDLLKVVMCISVFAWYCMTEPGM
ncbi:hypothetical protein C6Q18_10030 [Pseudomonas chlororaphis subsp. piscium]|nr:hypothetical protein C6Q18_10030 [Pseudomonas chlororaphis subsp. piscium]